MPQIGLGEQLAASPAPAVAPTPLTWLSLKTFRCDSDNPAAQRGVACNTEFLQCLRMTGAQ